MIDCPEIEALLAHDPAAARHAASCAACGAMLSLVKVRSERLELREDACVETEVALALGQHGLLDGERSAALSAHVAACADCNELAVRLSSTRDHAEGRAVPRWALAAGWATSLALAAAVGALWMRARVAPTPPAVAEQPRRLPEPAPPGAGAAPAPPTPCPTPAPEDPKQVAPPAPRRTSPDVVNPWAPPSAALTGGTGYLTVMCVPGCDSVRVNGKHVGPSPVVREAVPAGSTQVELRRESVVRRLVVQIAAGQVSARRVSMQADDRKDLIDPWY